MRTTWTRSFVLIAALSATGGAQDAGDAPCPEVARLQALDRSAERIRRDLSWMADRLARLAAVRASVASVGPSPLSTGEAERRRLSEIHVRGEFLRRNRAEHVRMLADVEAEIAVARMKADEPRCRDAPVTSGA